MDKVKIFRDANDAGLFINGDIEEALSLSKKAGFELIPILRRQNHERDYTDWDLIYNGKVHTNLLKKFFIDKLSVSEDNFNNFWNENWDRYFDSEEFEDYISEKFHKPYIPNYDVSIYDKNLK